MRKIYLSAVYILGFGTLMSFQNCSQTKFSSIDPVEKAVTLESHGGLDPVVVDGEGLDPQIEASLPPVQPRSDVRTDDSPAAPAPSADPRPDGVKDEPERTTSSAPNNPIDDEIQDNPTTRFSGDEIEVVRWCRGANRDSALMDAKDISITVKDGSQVICEASGAEYLTEIIETGRIKLPNCDLSKIIGNPIVEVKDDRGQFLHRGTHVTNSSINNAFSSFEGTRKDALGHSYMAGARGKLIIHLLLEKQVNRNNMPENCDAYNASPLVVDMRSREELSQPFTLTAPENGILFDILGMNSDPKPYTKKLISWMEDSRVMPIVLPKEGKEAGIDLLFGDNTLGPDGKFAENGFEALAKYDGLNLKSKRVFQRDQKIDDADEVYHLLKLWNDKNLDGVIDRDELISLEDAGVTVIDLDYDKKYASEDRHGNEIRFKSVLKLKSGDLKPVFDIWFLINNKIQ